KYGISYANGSGNAGPISIQYGMRGVPETYFIAPDGRLIRKWNTLPAADLEQFLGELLRASGARTSSSSAAGRLAMAPRGRGNCLPRLECRLVARWTTARRLEPGSPALQRGHRVEPARVPG